MNLNLFYTLDADHNPVPTDDPLVWGRWFEDFDNRSVAYDELEKVRVSTVFVGTAFEKFETMVFPMKGDRLFEDMECERYDTWDEAVAGHAAMLEKWREKET